MEENETRHNTSTHHSAGYQPKPKLNKAIFISVFAVLLVAASFYIGTLYQKNHTNTSADTTSGSTSSGSNYFGGAGGGYRHFSSNRVFGTVSAISSGSISIQDLRNGNTSTYSITSSTQIEQNGQTASTSDIQTGDIVIIAKSNSNQAATITIRGTANSSGNAPGQNT